jgi:U3 small nucleolar RNA-associated protein 20
VTVLEQCLSVEYDASLHTALLRVVSAGLYAGQMPVWTGVGRRVLEHTCKLHPRLGVELFGTLSDIGWRGWGMIGAPLLLRRTPEGLDRQPALMLRLLAKLHQTKKLGEVDQVWKERTGKWIANELAHWVQTEEQVGNTHSLILLCLSFFLGAPTARRLGHLASPFTS